MADKLYIYMNIYDLITPPLKTPSSKCVYPSLKENSLEISLFINTLFTL